MTANIDLYKITVKIPTPPIYQTREFLVVGLDSVQRVRTEAANYGYEVLRWEHAIVDTPAEVTSAVIEEKRATAVSIGELAYNALDKGREKARA